MGLKLITEDNFNVDVKSDDKNLYLEGIFASAEKQNQNGRVYPKNILSREIDKIMENVKNKTCLGELSHPDRPEVALERAAIMADHIEWRDNDVWGRAKVLSTPMGQIARSLINDGVRYGISTRGLGTVNEDSRVNEDYQLLCWDLVSNPSNYGSWVNGIYEAKEFGSEVKDTEKKINEFIEKIKTVDTVIDFEKLLREAEECNFYEFDNIKTEFNKKWKQFWNK